MIDVHSHIIPNVDDGAKNIEETFKMIEEAKKVGFTDIIMTPHYLENYYKNDSNEIVFWTQKLTEVLKQKQIDLKVHFGMEIYISNKMEELLKNKAVLTLCNSRYILIEMPLSSKINYLEYVIFVIKSFNLVPIIAHPERYKYIQQQPKLIEEILNEGCLLQCNYGSILGLYGRKAKATIKRFLKNDIVDFLGSDCHMSNTIYCVIPTAIKKIKKIIGKDKIEELTNINPRKILDNEEW
ncbi:MAG: PHP domain-containing protein [Clostridia bacterium]|nr:PHP domain-containing protein [Clostridia bacterium]